MPATNDAVDQHTSEHVSATSDHVIGSKRPIKDTSSATHDDNRREDGDLHLLLQQFTTILFQNDTNGLLNGRRSEEKQDNELTMDAIQDKLDTYTSIKDFKHDLKRVFQSALEKLSGSHYESLVKLYDFAMNTLQFESRRMIQNESDDDEHDFIDKRIALFRPTLDGFVFSDSVPASSLHENKDKLPSGIQEMVVYPSSSACTPSELSNLKTVVPPPPRHPSRVHRHEDKPAVPIQWLDYGAFSSFAPTRDSNHANVSYESTYMGRAAKRFRRWEKKQRNLQTLGKPTSPSPAKQNGVSPPPPSSQKDDQDNDKVDTEWLRKQGLDADAIVAAAESGSFNVDDLVDNNETNIDGQLERNAELLDYLSQYQEYRFGLGDARWGSIDEAEQEIANALQKRMQKLISKVSPKDLIDASTIESAMKRLPLVESVYRGTLPPNKLFAYPTSEKLEPIPPIANAIPGYPKERWRVFDIPPIPSRQPTTTNGGESSSRATNPPPPQQSHPSSPATGNPMHNSSQSPGTR
ncbi:hypothetical protein K492DRAFT_238868 [Lichtheimia hyalospora FSU 10163]|nr:hypothetical protein K492DRAFT_238868 [Lichtheimia hyalospora FSU 10163]